MSEVIPLNPAPIAPDRQTADRVAVLITAQAARLHQRVKEMLEALETVIAAVVVAVQARLV